MAAVGELEPGTVSDYGSLNGIDCLPGLRLVRINPPRAPPTPPKEVNPLCRVRALSVLMSTFHTSETLIGSRLADSIPQESWGIGQ
jgi:hypothetical protein